MHPYGENKSQGGQIPFVLCIFYFFFFLREGSVFIFDKRVYLTKEYICLCFAVLQLGFKHTAAEKQYRDVKRLAVR